MKWGCERTREETLLWSLLRVLCENIPGPGWHCADRLQASYIFVAEHSFGRNMLLYIYIYHFPVAARFLPPKFVEATFEL
jgi:hypothetical protein